MTERELFKETFSHLHASPDTLSEVMNMAKHDNITHISTAKRRRPARRLIAIVAVAALLVTGAVAAGTAIYKMSAEPIGEYGLSLMVDFENTAPSVEVKQTPVLDITPGWLPEGMTLNPGDTMKYSYEETPWQGGFSMLTWTLDTGKETFRETITNMQSRESLTIAGHEAEYITLLSLERESVGFNQMLYIAYPEYNRVLQIYIGEDVDKDTAVKFAENLVITETGEYLDKDIINYHGDYYKAADKTARTGERHNWDKDIMWEPETKLIATAEEMANTHQIGESFENTVWQEDAAGMVPVSLKVTDVTVGDDASIFGEGFENSDLAASLDENGKAPMNVIQFVKQGDGLNSLTEIVEEREEPTKLVAVTFDVTNNTEQTLEHVHYFATLLMLEEIPDGFAVWEPPSVTDVEYDYVSMSRARNEMRWHSVSDDYGNGGNYIPSIAPGETVSVEVGFLVSECQLDKLFLSLDGGGGTYFDEEGLAMGYVDIRQ